MSVPRRRSILPSLLLVLLVVIGQSAAWAQVPTPEAFFGFKMGADGQLADWPQIEKYFGAVAASAPHRVVLLDVGPTTEGRRILAALITSPENHKQLETIRAVNRRLADPRGLSADEARLLTIGQPVVVAIGASIHASEIGATQMANELLYELATSVDARTLEILRHTVVVLMPSLNPDGHTLVVDYFRRTNGTSMAGGSMPWLYHRYAGHDINRDAFMMNLAENRTLSRFFYDQWHPQVFLAMHQMGSRGPRLFVPPNYDPIPPNYDPMIWRTASLLGQAMAFELERHGRSGVISNALFDYYWPGYEDSAPLGHNTVCLLTEAASVRLALPVTVTPAELSTSSGAGLPEYRPQMSFPNPWPGGTWRLRDIVDYELDAVRGLLGAASLYRQQLVESFQAMARRAVELGRAGSPFAFIIPPDQHDPNAASRLTRLLIEGGVEVQQAQEPFRVGEATYPTGTALVLMAQPFRAYAKTLLERQDYPIRRLTRTSPPERPYDVAGWTLGWQMGVRVDRIEEPFQTPLLAKLERAAPPPAQLWGDRRPDYYVIDARGTSGALALTRVQEAGLTAEWSSAPLETNGYRYPAGSIVVRDPRRARDVVAAVARDLGLRADGVKGRTPPTRPLLIARVGLYRPWLENMDEGWTRYLLEQYRVPFRSLTDADIRKGGLRAGLDVIILPDAQAQQLRSGQRAGAVPPEYAGGLGTEGVAALKTFVEAGGRLVCLGGSAHLAIEALALPIKNAVQGLPADQFFCPGSILRLQVGTDDPLAFGMAASTGGFFSRGAVLEADPAKPGADRVRVIARFAEKDVLMSGWLEGEAAIAGKPAMLEIGSGAGSVVMYSIRPQHRAQSLGTFRLLFNALAVTATNRQQR